jgi:hypothetical protein
MKWGVGLEILCVRRLSEDGTPVPKHVVVILIMNSFYVCILLSAFVCEYTEYTNMHSFTNIKFVKLTIQNWA